MQVILRTKSIFFVLKSAHTNHTVVFIFISWARYYVLCITY